MYSSPVGDKSCQQIRKGDRAKVAGTTDLDLLDRRELMADLVIIHKRDETRSEKATGDS